MGKHTLQELQQKQALPLNVKIKMTENRITEWVDQFGENGVYVSFSGGKDSTVLLDIARRLYPNIKAVFVDTGLEYPEIRQFVKTFENVDIVRPKMTFKDVIEKYGYPFISKEVSNNVDGARKYIKLLTDRQTDPGFRIPITTDEYAELVSILNADWGKVKASPQRLAILLGILGKKGMAIAPNSGERSMFSMERYNFFLEAPFNISDRCCNVMKKSPARVYEKRENRKPILGTLATESRLRTQKWIQEGCNAFDSKHPESKPMSLWTEQDVLLYIYENKLPIASIYGDVVIDYYKMGQCDGQMRLADYGEFEKERPLLKTTGCSRTGCMYCGFGCHLEKSPNRFERMKETHPKQYDYIMRPKDEGGLGYKEIIDWINKNGNMDIRY